MSLVSFQFSSNCLCVSKEQLNKFETLVELIMNISKVAENLEIFNFEQDLELTVASRHWIEWIWDVFWLLLIEIMGNACLFATFSYERFGMDPQKRTVINQLLSQMCWIIIALNITCLPIIVVRR